MEENKSSTSNGMGSGGCVPNPRVIGNGSEIIVDPNAINNINDNQNHIIQDQIMVDAYRMPKLPDFVRSDPALWFAQVELQLNALGQLLSSLVLISKPYNQSPI